MTQRKRMIDRARVVGTHIKSNPMKYAGGTVAAVAAMVLGLQATGTINTFSLEAFTNFFNLNFDNSTNIDKSTNTDDHSINQTIEVHQDGDTYVVTYPDGTTRAFDSIEAVREEHPEWTSEQSPSSRRILRRIRHRQWNRYHLRLDQATQTPISPVPNRHRQRRQLHRLRMPRLLRS